MNAKRFWLFGLASTAFTKKVKPFVLCLAFMMLGSVLSAQDLDSYRIGVEYQKTVRLPEGDILRLKPMIFEQPVMLRVWRHRGEINDWQVAFTGLDSGRHDLKNWLDGVDSLPVDLNVFFLGTLTDSDDGNLRTVHTPWTQRYPLPAYTTLMFLVIAAWVLLLPALWFVRRRLYPPPPVVHVIPEYVPSTLEKIESYLDKYERDGKLNIEEESEFFTLLLQRWRELRSDTELPAPENLREICTVIAKDEQFGAVYGMIERWMFAPGNIPIDPKLVRTACRELPKPEASEADGAEGGEDVV